MVTNKILLPYSKYEKTKEIWFVDDFQRGFVDDLKIK